MSNPYGVPSAPPQKSRTGLYIGIACGCLLLVAVLVAVVGVGLWLFSRDGGGEDPTSGPSISQSPSEDPTTEEAPTDDPTTEDPTDDPTETPSEDPSTDPDSSAGASISIQVSAPSEGATLDTQDETLETENGKFIGVEVNLTNNGSEDIGLAGKNFRFYDDAGNEHSLRYASFSTSGPQVTPGEEATAQLYADVPTDMVLKEISYTDVVGTGGEEITFPVG
ncbi:hypothetical protein GCM10023160_28460 [Brachybacterium paraconglomeratum]|uniref:DUF4352 domain-containing protein n=1 Tax=Brachybacterium paraconglomeratum TaxID=173362 RepID=UPI0031E87CAF